MKATLDRDQQGNLIRKAGIMSVVIAAGEVRPDDPIQGRAAARPRSPLEPV